MRLYRELSGASLELIRILQQSPEWCRIVDSLTKDWEADALIHFDLRWDNIVLSVPPARKNPFLKLVDWELAGPGDRCWDIGSILADYLSFWLFSIPGTLDGKNESLPGPAGHPLEQIQPATRSFWTAYARQSKLSGNSVRRLLLKSTRFMAVRLVQIAYEHMQKHALLTSSAIYLLQLSENILRRPGEAIVHLLGIPLGEEGQLEPIS